VPQSLILAIVEFSSTRKDFNAEEIILEKPKTVGVFRLIMKFDADSWLGNRVLLHCSQYSPFDLMVT
jgi:UDPglucose 6-dehydrogenase